MGYVQYRIRRVYRNRMILCGILAAWMGIPVLAGIASLARGGISESAMMGMVATLPMTSVPLGFFIHALIMRANWKHSKYYTGLGKLGLGDADAAAALLDAEMNEQRIYYTRHMNLTYHWVTVEEGQRFHAHPVRDLIWIYPHIVRTNGVVTSRSLVLVYADRTQRRMPCGDEKECMVLLQLLSEMCPYTVSGYSKERERDFKAARNLFTVEAIRQRWQDYPPEL